MTDQTLMDILAELRSIHALLAAFPELLAAVHFQMMDEHNAARLSGMKAEDLWIIPPQNQR
jgi:hypothetical protein